MFFVIDENNNRIEAFDKEGVLAVLAQAIADGSLSGITADSAFVSKLKCCVTGGTNRVAFVTQAKYNELKASDSLLADCLYIVTDDTTAEDMDATLSELSETVNAVMGGSQAVPKASHANEADKAKSASEAVHAYHAEKLSGIEFLMLETVNSEKVAHVDGTGIYLIEFRVTDSVSQTDILIISDLSVNSAGTARLERKYNQGTENEYTGISICNTYDSKNQWIECNIPEGTLYSVHKIADL